MRTNQIAALLTLATSIFLAPAAGAAGMIVIDPIVGGGPGILPVTGPVPVRPPVRPPGVTNPPGTLVPIPPVPDSERPVLSGKVTFGLRLEQAEVKVDITDQVAKTYITQTFVNDTDRNLAGTYLFPLPDDTTFSSFSLHIDGKPVEGKILEAHEARQQYEAIVRKMIDPGLLEYADHKTVRARIFPIPARGTKKVELEYTQLLKAENGMLRYKFPLKAGAEAAPVESVKVTARLNSKPGLRTIWSPTHAINTTRDGNHKARIVYSESDVVPDKDFILHYSVSDKDMAANLITHKASGEDGYYLLTLSPPVEMKQAMAKDIVLVADTSGSMQGERMEQNKKALKYIVNALSPEDNFSIVEFNTDVESFRTKLVPATPENRKAALAFIDDLEARGGTNIGDALKTGVTILDQPSNRPAYLILMTDGEPTVGETKVDGLLKIVSSKREIRLFDFGIGYDINTRLLNKLAESNHGVAQYLEPDESIEHALASFYNKIKSPVLSNVKLAYDGVQVKDVYPREVKDIFAGNQIMLLGRYKAGSTASVKLTGTVNGVPRSYTFPLTFASSEAGHTYLPRLWAMRRIGHLTDVAQDNNNNNREIVDEIVALSRKFGIISAYTSFLVTEPGMDLAAARPGQPVPFGRPASAPRAMTGANIGGGSGSPAEADLARRTEAVRASSRVKWDDRLAYSPAPAPAASREGRKGVPYAGTAGGPSLNAAVSARMLQRASGFAVMNEREIADRIKSKLAGGGSSGKDAVLVAKELSELKRREQLEKAGSAAGIKTVDDKTFYLKDGFWTDSTYDARKHPSVRTITFGSKEYFELLNNKGMAKYLSVGRQVILIFQDRAYKIVYSPAS